MRLPARHRIAGFASCWLVALLAAALACTSGGPGRAPFDGGETVEWLSCRTAADCTWLIGEGGWPVAINRERKNDYLAWVRSQAPFTTYYAPSDCFAHSEESDDYAARSQGAVTCDAARCRIDLEPVCTHRG